MKFDIDFVVTWVDANDLNWQNSFSSYYIDEKHEKIDASETRYRDWGLFKYWIRGIEKFAPWVRYVHLVTCGHVPNWLDTTNPKIRIVHHEDYIPWQYLPVFNSNAIEIMMHKIPNLAEHFVYFNDDFFLIRPITPDYFFHKGIPCDMAVISITYAEGIMKGITDKNMSIIKQEFGVFQCIRNNPFVWFNYKYRKFLLNTFRGFVKSVFINPGDTHAPQPYFKSTWDKAWEKYGTELKQTLTHRFRNHDDNSHWMFRYWQILEGNIFPRDILYTTKVYYDVFGNISELCDCISNQKYAVVVINDSLETSDIEIVISKIKAAFNHILPEPSSFEI